MIRVCHLTIVHGPFDDRIFFKQCVSLANSGYEVIEVAPIEKESVESGVRIVPVRVPRGRLLRALVGGWRAYRVVKRLKPHIVHFHDPELIPIGFLLKRKGMRVIYDMHELVHRQVLDKVWIGPLVLRRAIARVYGWVEHLAVKRFDAIVLAEARYQDELFPLHPDYVQKFTLVRNFPVLTIIDKTRQPIPKAEGFTVIYVGGLSEARGIRALIEAVGMIQGVNLWLLGDWATQTFKKQCESLPGYGSTKWFGKVRMDEVYGYIRAADLGACVLHPLPNYVVTEPIKTYEYLACGIPLLLSDFPYWHEVFGPWAWFTDSLAADAIAEVIRAARDNVQERDRKAQAGRMIVEQERCWEHEKDYLVNLYARLAQLP